MRFVVAIKIQNNLSAAAKNSKMLSFIRQLHSSSYRLKDLAKFVDKSTKIPTLKGSPTIYNPVNSASNYKGYMRAKVEPGMYYNPVQSLPTGSTNIETFPSMFLAKDDPRLELIETLQGNDPLKTDFAPPVLISKSTANVNGKMYHLKPEQIEEIISLRESNPEKYTRKVLAKKFDVSPLFISLVSQAPKARLEEMESRLEIIKLNFHPKRAIAREDRKKRKWLWYRA